MGWSWIAVVAVGLGVLGIVAYTSATRLVPSEPFRPVASIEVGVGAPTPGAEGTLPARITVHVSGAVASPGLVDLPEGARVADAVLAAGGATSDADLEAINLAEPVADAVQLRVPRQGEAVAPSSGSGSSAVGADGVVRLDIATVDDLETLPGIGPVLARRIFDHREAVGGFTTVEDLLDVPGIGERTLANLRPHLLLP